MKMAEPCRVLDHLLHPPHGVKVSPDNRGVGYERLALGVDVSQALFQILAIFWRGSRCYLLEATSAVSETKILVVIFFFTLSKRPDRRLDKHLASPDLHSQKARKPHFVTVLWWQS